MLIRTLNDPFTLMDTDIWAVADNGKEPPVPVVQTKFEERDARFSPDHHWIAYQSKATGRFEIYVQPYPGPGQPTRVSVDGGASVSWGAGGKELVFLALDGTLTAVPLSFTSDGKRIDNVGKPVSLFFANVNGVQDYSRSYALSPDGKRILVDVMVEEKAPAITVIVNWKPKD
jgi:Tol biopolymer transport system component